MIPFLEPSGFSCSIACFPSSAGVAQWLIRKGVVPKKYVASQGTCIHRRGRIHISTTKADSADAEGAEEQVWVAGHAVTCISGSVLL